MQILRWADRRTMAWKNGGGVTHEILVSERQTPFDWRISIAEIRQDGPFSEFSGYDRHFCVLEGGVELSLNQQPPLSLTPLTPPLKFSGDDKVSARISQASTDLNLMVKKSAYHGDIEPIWLKAQPHFECIYGHLILLTTGHIQVPSQEERLNPYDCVWMQSGEVLDLDPEQTEVLIYALRLTPL